FKRFQKVSNVVVEEGGIREFREWTRMKTDFSRKEHKDKRKCVPIYCYKPVSELAGHTGAQNFWTE
ncbi:MAG: hypothetical protein ACREFR_03195, partial [Limisphaerales bacterium]